MNWIKAVSHGLVTLALAAVASALGLPPWAGAVAGVAMFVGREAAQHEINQATGPLGGYNVLTWRAQSWADVLLPAAVLGGAIVLA